MTTVAVLQHLSRRDWSAIVEHAAVIVRSYDTRVTLRQLFYRLVSDGTLANTKSDYVQLASYTAEARRSNGFPALMDRTRRIHRGITFSDVSDARTWLASIYRCDRTKGQETSVYLAVEKAGIVEQLTEWFGAYGLPIIALSGYSSQTYVDEIVEDVESFDRPAVLLYAGDFDASGEDIDRDFVQRTNCFNEVRRIALTREQVECYQLPPMPGKPADTRAGSFIERHGTLMQVELDALPPDVLRALYTEAVDEFLNLSRYEAVLKREARERRALTRQPRPKEKRR